MDASLDSHVKTLKLLGHPARLRILSVLRRGELTVSELTTVLEMSQPRVTQYIKALEEGGLVERLREGSWVFVRLRTPQVDPLKTVLSGLPKGDSVLDGDGERLATVRKARSDISEAFFADVANDRGQLSHEFIPSAPTESLMLSVAGEGPFGLMVDLGTGSGRMLELFASRVERGLGIDLSPDMLRVARHKLAGEAHISVQLGNIERTEIADGVADLLTLHQVLHYLDEPAIVLSEAARLLRPGGRLLIADFAEHDRDAFRQDFAHRRLGFGGEELRRLLDDHGFTNTTISRVDGAGGDAPDVLLWSSERAPAPAQNRT